MTRLMFVLVGVGSFFWRRAQVRSRLRRIAYRNHRPCLAQRVRKPLLKRAAPQAREIQLAPAPQQRKSRGGAVILERAQIKHRRARICLTRLRRRPCEHAPAEMHQRCGAAEGGRDERPRQRATDPQQERQAEGGTDKKDGQEDQQPCEHWVARTRMIHGRSPGW